MFFALRRQKGLLTAPRFEGRRSRVKRISQTKDSKASRREHRENEVAKYFLLCVLLYFANSA
jgi:hypothetical protein